MPHGGIPSRLSAVHSSRSVGGGIVVQSLGRRYRGSACWVEGERAGSVCARAELGVSAPFLQ